MIRRSYLTDLPAPKTPKYLKVVVLGGALFFLWNLLPAHHEALRLVISGIF
jgi:hypothetical protein